MPGESIVGMVETEQKVSNQEEPPNKKPDHGLFVGILFGVFSIFFFVLQSNGVEVNWLWSAALYAFCTIAVVWTTLRHALPGKGRMSRIAVILLLVLICIVLGSIGTVKQYRKEHPLDTSKSGVQHPSPPLSSGAQEKPSTTDKQPVGTQENKKRQGQSFPKNPLELLDYNGKRSGIIQNNTAEKLFLLGFRTTVDMSPTMPLGEDSASFSIDKPIGAHETVTFDANIPGSYSTLRGYASANWDEAEAAAQEQYKQCLRPFLFSPDSVQLQQLKAFYAHVPFPTRDATGIIAYRRGSEFREQRVPLKAVMFVDNGCTPQ